MPRKASDVEPQKGRSAILLQTASNTLCNSMRSEARRAKGNITLGNLIRGNSTWGPSPEHPEPHQYTPETQKARAGRGRGPPPSAARLTNKRVYADPPGASFPSCRSQPSKECPISHHQHAQAYPHQAWRAIPNMYRPTIQEHNVPSNMCELAFQVYASQRLLSQPFKRAISHLARASLLSRGTPYAFQHIQANRAIAQFPIYSRSNMHKPTLQVDNPHSRAQMLHASRVRQACPHTSPKRVPNSTQQQTHQLIF